MTLAAEMILQSRENEIPQTCIQVVFDEKLDHALRCSLSTEVRF